MTKLIGQSKFKGVFDNTPCEICNKKEWIVYKDKNHICDKCYRVIYTHPLDAKP